MLGTPKALEKENLELFQLSEGNDENYDSSGKSSKNVLMKKIQNLSRNFMSVISKNSCSSGKTPPSEKLKFKNKN